eukprot:m.29179 g.29179  ORF g.29179 m.29179 type:complete len:351 (-) comp8072_c0_seq1:45-1097(-)
MLRVFVACAALAAISAVPLKNSFQNEKGNLKLSWEITGAEIEMEVLLNGSTYVAVGLGIGMAQSDMMIGYVSSDGSCFAGDYWSTGHQEPKMDTTLGGTDDVTVETCSYKAGSGTTLRWKRKLNTGDKYDVVIPSSGPVNLIYAWSSSAKPGQICYHGDNHNHITLDFSKSDGLPSGVTGAEETGKAARILVNQASVGTLVTMQTEGAGNPGVSMIPYGSVASFADSVPSTGSPILLLSSLERNVINLQGYAKCSLAIPQPVANNTPSNTYEPMATARTTLLGHLEIINKTTASKNAYLKKHPMASMWIDFDDFDLYKFIVDDVYWVGGFGNGHYIGWIGADMYYNQSIN